MLDSPTVTLSIPAKGDYLSLARLALSAICRLTSLRAEDVADLKLAVTEAATALVGDDPEQRLHFSYRLADDRLVLEIEGPGRDDRGDEEAELGRAIVAATVDEHELLDGRVRLVKHLAPPGD